MENINEMIFRDFEEILELRIKGENYLEIDAMVDSLKTISTISKLYTKDNYSKSDIKIIVERIEPGNSITAYLKIIGEAITFAGGAIGVAAGIVKLYKLKKDLKGKKPVSIETKIDDSNNIIVTNHVGDNIEVNINIFNTYVNNPQIDKELSNYAGKLEKYNRVGFDIKEVNLENHNESSSIELNNEELRDFAVNIPVEEIDVNPEEVLTIETLNLVIPKYNSSAMWEFINSDGNRIKAHIHDVVFLERINSGLIGTTGKTEMEVELLTIINKGLTTGDRELKKRYYIKKVRKIINPMEEDEVTLFDYDFGD